MGATSTLRQQNLIHRDIKPSDIMVTMHGDNIINAKIIDLGLAKGAVADDGSISEISDSGSFCWDTRLRRSRAVCWVRSEHTYRPH